MRFIKYIYLNYDHSTKQVGYEELRDIQLALETKGLSDNQKRVVSSILSALANDLAEVSQ